MRNLSPHTTPSPLRPHLPRTIGLSHTSVIANRKTTKRAFVLPQAFQAIDPISPADRQRIPRGTNNHAKTSNPGIARNVLRERIRSKSTSAPASAIASSAGWTSNRAHPPPRKQSSSIISSSVQSPDLHWRQDCVLPVSDQPGSDELA